MNRVRVQSIVILSAACAAGVLAAAGGIVAGQTSTPAPAHATHSTPPGGQSVDATAKARLAAAERVCKILHDQETGAPRGHQGVEHTYLWSKRRMEAQREVDMVKDGGITALEEHLARMRAWNERVAKSGVYSGFDMTSTEYYVAEAEDLLARAKAK